MKIKSNNAVKITKGFEPVTPPFSFKPCGPSLNLGTNELRGHHSVMIEAGKIPRGRVMDQHIIDRYLMRGLLSLGQHRAGEYLLQQATRAGIWPTGIDLTSSGGVKSNPNYVPFGAFPFGRTLALIKSRYGHRHRDIVLDVICYSVDVSRDTTKLDWLCEGLDLIDAIKLRGRGDPLRKLRLKAQAGTVAG